MRVALSPRGLLGPPDFSILERGRPFRPLAVFLGDDFLSRVAAKRVGDVNVRGGIIDWVGEKASVRWKAGAPATSIRVKQMMRCLDNRSTVMVLDKGSLLDVAAGE